jgi:hypothetical protein
MTPSKIMGKNEKIKIKKIMGVPFQKMECQS